MNFLKILFIRNLPQVLKLVEQCPCLQHTLWMILEETSPIRIESFHYRINMLQLLCIDLQKPWIPKQ